MISHRNFFAGLISLTFGADKFFLVRDNHSVAV
jgi:hypothetical protein